MLSLALLPVSTAKVKVPPVGAMLSTIKLKLLASPMLPLASTARTFSVCAPCDNTCCEPPPAE
jgi:hypothetical protein